MKTEDIGWCSQHGFPSPCYKCGYPLTGRIQQEIYNKGRLTGITEVIQTLKPYLIERPNTGKIRIVMDYDLWESKLKEWTEQKTNE